MNDFDKEMFYPGMGQRKLLLMEVKFLSMFDCNKVLYIGAAPGKHITMLTLLFPNHIFHLYDNREFHNSLKDCKNVSMYHQLFTEQDAITYNSDWLFISDIRSDITGRTEQVMQSCINQDMQLQMRINNIIQPYASMLKFNLPDNNQHTVYYQGDVWLQPWSPLNTRETRLIVKNISAMCTYSHQKYTQILAGKDLTRSTFHTTKPIKGCPGLCGCNDCLMEIDIWKLYIKHRCPSQPISNSNISRYIRMSNTWTVSLGKHKLRKTTTMQSVH